MKLIVSSFFVFISATCCVAQSSGPNPPPPPTCSQSISGQLYTDTTTQQVYSCNYFNLAWQWVAIPVNGGLTAQYTPPGTCSGPLPVYVTNWPNTILDVCVNGVPTPIYTASGTVTAKTFSGTGTPTDPCSSSQNNFAIEINATPTAYQCSNATGSYAWNTLGGGGGGYTNVTGSASETTVAQIDANCGAGTYYATTPLSIATGGTVTCPVQFSKAGLWTISSGQTVTFAAPVTETDGPAQHFSGSGTVVLAPQDRWAEWWGAVGVANGGSPSVDSTSAINACIPSSTAGACRLQALEYMTSAHLTIAAGGQGLIGAPGSTGNIGGGYTEIISSSATDDIIDAHFASSTTGVVLKHLFLRRSVAVTSGTAAGVSLINANNLMMDDVLSADSAQDFYFHVVDTSKFTNLIAEMCQFTGYSGVSNVYGFYLDGAQNSPYATSLLAVSACSTPTTYGIYFNGTIDASVDGINTAGVNYGAYLNGTNDVIIRNVVFDQTKTVPLYATGSFVTTSISQGRVDSNNGVLGNGINLTSASNLAISDFTVKESYSLASVWLSFSNNNVITGLTVNGCGTSGLCVGLQSSNNNVITSNSLNSTSTGLSLTNSSYNQIGGNSFGSGQGGSTALIILDSNSNHNHWANNNAFFTTTGTLISDLGTDNQFASSTGLSGMNGGQVAIAGSPSTITSSKPLAGSGAGIVTGPTTSTNGDCVEFSGTTGQIADTGSPCGSGGGSGSTFSGSVTASATQTVTLVSSAPASQLYQICAGMSINTGSPSSWGMSISWTENGATTTSTPSPTATVSTTTPTFCVAANPDTGTNVTLNLSQAGTPGTGVYYGTIGGGSSSGGGTGGNGFFTFTPLVAANFAWFNQGSCTNTATSNTEFLSCPTNGAADSWRYYVEAQPSTPYTVTTWISEEALVSNYMQKGLALYDSSSQKATTFNVVTGNCSLRTSNFYALALQVDTVTNNTTYGSNLLTLCIPPAGWIGLRITVSAVGGTDTYYYSVDGVNWIQAYSATDGSFQTQNKVGFDVNPNSQHTSGTGVPSGGFGETMTIASFTD